MRETWVMDRERYLQVEKLLRSALEREPDRRAAFLAEACQDDEALRREVSSLLQYDASPECLLDRPAADHLLDPTHTILDAGSQLGPYRIERPLGAGGMGEVYRAIDTRLDRKVAIKVCARRFSSRFEREARAISALNHPHICTLYDVGPNYLVMELVEGETLAARLTKGPLPMEMVLRYGAQIADALAAAHAQGIIHRDLKPSNIMVTRSGVKVLDFGLAKLTRPVTPDAQPAEPLTASHAVMGTLAYMAPEQLEGRECDARSDIFSLGLVLYEMCTGRRAFASKTHAELVDEVMRCQPAPIENASSQMRAILACLARDPEDRWQSARDLKRELEWASTGENKSAKPASANTARRYAWPLAAVLLCLILGVAARVYFQRAPAATPVVRLSIPLPEESAIESPQGTVGPPAISPDGSTVAIVLGGVDKRSLWLRRLDSDRFDRLPGTEGAVQPFWSPDGRQIAFFAGGKLKKMPVSGGEPQNLCAVPESAERGGAWSPAGTIVYGVNYAGLFRVSDRGGSPQQVAGLDQGLGENSLRNPAFLPDGNRFVYFSRTRNLDNRAVYLYSLDGESRKPRKKLVVADQQIAVGRDSASGRDHLLFSRGGKLWEQSFDAGDEALAGEAAPISEDVGEFSVSATGVLVSRRTGSADIRFTWFDRGGRELGILGDPVDSWGLNLSPDDKYLAFSNHRSLDGHFSVWIVDIARNVASPFSVLTERSLYPVWSPDSARVVFYSDREGADRIFVKGIGDVRPEQPLTSSFERPYRYHPTDVSFDGKFVLAERYEGSDAATTKPYYASLGKNDWRPLLAANAWARQPQFSPDARWVAYSSHETGAWEVYVADFPNGRSQQRISAAGGIEPRWRRDGKELLYYAPDEFVMSVDMGKGPGLSPQKPVPLFKVQFSSLSDSFHYALARDGQRIMAAKAGTVRSRDLNVIFNWSQLVKR
jgi:serine/threonine protein kinase/Tol biopolymer transport system component